MLQPAGLSDEPPPAGALRDRWDSLLAVVGIAEELADADSAAGLAALVGELDQRAEVQHAPAADGVTLASLHAAKGLEWDAVFLVGLVDGTLPIQHADTPEAVEEERRLFYVGVTRARTAAGPVLGAGPYRGRPADPPAEPVPHRSGPRVGEARPGPRWRAAAGSAAAG